MGGSGKIGRKTVIIICLSRLCFHMGFASEYRLSNCVRLSLIRSVSKDFLSLQCLKLNRFTTTLLMRTNIFSPLPLCSLIYANELISFAPFTRLSTNVTFQMTFYMSFDNFVIHASMLMSELIALRQQRRIDFMESKFKFRKTISAESTRADGNQSKLEAVTSFGKSFMTSFRREHQRRILLTYRTLETVSFLFFLETLPTACDMNKFSDDFSCFLWESHQKIYSGGVQRDKILITCHEAT